MEITKMRKNIAILLTIVAILVVALLAPLQYGAPATAAPAAAPTPVAGVLDRTSTDPGYIIFTDPISITADTRYCPGNTSRYDTMDLEYAINQGTVNTTTITLQYTNRQQRYADGPDVVTANAADTAGMQQFPTFGRFTCILVDVANSNSISITLNAVGK
jgi:hypothetical protein